jgi:hypothetical protein
MGYNNLDFLFISDDSTLGSDRIQGVISTSLDLPQLAL